MTDRELMQQALEALIGDRAFLESDAPVEIWGVNDKAITALRERLAQLGQPEWADKCRIELVTAIHSITSDYENALGAFGEDAEARRKAEGDIAHARKVASRWSWNGAGWVGLTDEDEIPWDGVDAKSFARAIEAKLKEKNA
jgi:hypothetical protein